MISFCLQERDAPLVTGDVSSFYTLSSVAMVYKGFLAFGESFLYGRLESSKAFCNGKIWEKIGGMPL